MREVKISPGKGQESGPANDELQRNEPVESDAKAGRTAQGYFTRCGKPGAFYIDIHGIFPGPINLLAAPRKP